MTCGVYRISFKNTDKVYVGSSKNIESRFVDHRNTLKTGKHHSAKLQNYYNKYNLEPSFKILEVCSEESRTIVEDKWIKELDSINNGFNVAEVVHSGLPTAESAITDSLPELLTIKTQLLYPPYNLSHNACVVEAYLSGKIRACKDVSIKYCESIPTIARNLRMKESVVRVVIPILRDKGLVQYKVDRNFHNKLSYANDEFPFVEQK